MVFNNSHHPENMGGGGLIFLICLTIYYKISRLEWTSKQKNDTKNPTIGFLCSLFPQIFQGSGYF